MRTLLSAVCLLLCLSSVEAGSKHTNLRADALPIDKEGYSNEWNEEWKKGDYPHWSEVHPKADVMKQYMDYQSDGKISPAGGPIPGRDPTFFEHIWWFGSCTMRSCKMVNDKPKPASFLQDPLPIDKEGYSNEWNEEWKKGDYPHWSEVHPKADVMKQYMDYQSDGKVSPAGGPIASRNPTFFEHIWWFNSCTIHDCMMVHDKPQPVALLQVTDPLPIDKEAYTDEWNEEWKKGDYPHWSEVHPKADVMKQYMDYQSDGKVSPAGGPIPSRSATFFEHIWWFNSCTLHSCRMVNDKPTPA